MTIGSVITADQILKRAAAELGLGVTNNPYQSTEDHFVQMQYLLQTNCEKLALAYMWEFLNEEHQITTAVATNPDGQYDLPADFHYMIPQTGWERNDNTPLFGPLSSQDWTYLKGRDLSTGTLYASFRIKEGVFALFPDPPADGLDVNFEYQRKTFVLDVDGSTHKADIETGDDTPLFDRTLMTAMLKLAFLESKGFDTTKAQNDFNQIFGFITGKDDGGGEIINAGGGSTSLPYLDTFRNTSDTSFGS